MEFNIDMSKVVKIVVEKDDKSFIEYTIDNGTIVDVSIIEKETTLEEKVKKLKENNKQVKTISKLIKFDNAGILDKMVQNDSESVFDTIKNDVVNNPIQESVIRDINETSDEINRDILTERAKDAVNIMKLDDKMNDFARANRETIAEHLFDENPNNADARPVLETIMDASSSKNVSNENLEVSDDLEKNEPKDNYEDAKAKNVLITDAIHNSNFKDADKIAYLKEALKKITDKVNE